MLGLPDIGLRGDEGADRTRPAAVSGVELGGRVARDGIACDPSVFERRRGRTQLMIVSGRRRRSSGGVAHCDSVSAGRRPDDGRRSRSRCVCVDGPVKVLMCVGRACVTLVLRPAGATRRSRPRPSPAPGWPPSTGRCHRGADRRRGPSCAASPGSPRHRRRSRRSRSPASTGTTPPHRP
jgi:hypothetical protein